MARLIHTLTRLIVAIALLGVSASAMGANVLRTPFAQIDGPDGMVYDSSISEKLGFDTFISQETSAAVSIGQIPLDEDLTFDMFIQQLCKQFGLNSSEAIHHTTSDGSKLVLFPQAQPSAMGFAYRPGSDSLVIIMMAKGSLPEANIKKYFMSIKLL